MRLEDRGYGGALAILYVRYVCIRKMRGVFSRSGVWQRSGCIEVNSICKPELGSEATDLADGVFLVVSAGGAQIAAPMHTGGCLEY